MTLEEAKTLKIGQEIYYRGLDEMPEKVIVSSILFNSSGKIEVNLKDNCYIPERDLDYIYLTFDECAEACEKSFKEKLIKLREMMKQEKYYEKIR